MLQVPVSRGYLAKVCTGIVSDSLADAYEEVKAAIPQQAQLGSDETSFKNNGKMNCSFAWNFDIKAQYCWAHLIREIRFLMKHPDKKTRVWAEQLQDRTRRLFSAWHTRDEMTETGLERSMKYHRAQFLEIAGAMPKTTEAMNLAARFAIVELSDGSTYDMSQDYFRFMFAEGLEPTNNHSEQQIRHVVIDRRITQGTRSESGQRYHERMWTAVATCKKQEKNFFEYLHSSIQAKLSDRPAPSLIRWPIVTRDLIERILIGVRGPIHLQSRSARRFSKGIAGQKERDCGADRVTFLRPWPSDLLVGASSAEPTLVLQGAPRMPHRSGGPAIKTQDHSFCPVMP